jgi:hypothetical protein
VVRVERAGTGNRVRVERPWFVVAVRHGEARLVKYDTASIDVGLAGTEATPIVWETTNPKTLETTRGTIRVDGAGEAHVALAEAPPPVAEDTRRGHRCRAYEDGAGGFTVLCSTGPIAVVKRLGADGPLTGAFRQGDFVRLDLVAQPERPDAFVVAYTEGNTNSRVVIRAEASLVAGEEQPSIALLSAERGQPAQVRFSPWRRTPDFGLDF